jgi:hypothetical protein
LNLYDVFGAATQILSDIILFDCCPETFKEVLRDLYEVECGVWKSDAQIYEKDDAEEICRSHSAAVSDSDGEKVHDM